MICNISCKSINIGAEENESEWKEKAILKFKMDPKELKELVTDSSGNGLYYSISTKNRNEGVGTYFIKFDNKCRFIRYNPISGAYNFRLVNRKLKDYLTKEQLDESIRILTQRPHF
jgi:hypothetical protein